MDDGLAVGGRASGADTGVDFSFRIAGSGVALPRQCLTNSALSAELAVTAHWIERRCGIHTRHVAGAETTSSLAVEAGLQALAGAAAQPDVLICTTFTPDYQMCPVAPSIASALGLGSIPAFDLNAACAGAVVGLLTALDLLRAGTYRSVLIIASDTTTKHLRREDAGTRILFGDGAAALLLARSEGRGCHILARTQGADGSGAGLFRLVDTQLAVRSGSRPYVEMDGRALFRFAKHRTGEMVRMLCAEAGCAPDDLSRIVIHQANGRIISALMDCLCTRRARWVMQLDRVGNLAGASVLHALIADIDANGGPVPGERVLLAAFGAGLSWAGVVIQW